MKKVGFEKEIADKNWLKKVEKDSLEKSLLKKAQSVCF